MNEKQLLKILSTQFGFLAKSTGESLIAHHYTTFCIVKRIISYIPSFKNKDQQKKMLLIAALSHDLGKKSEANQRILRNPQAGERIRHKPNEESFTKELKPYVDECRLLVSDIKAIFDMVVGHHSFSDTDLIRLDLHNAGYFTRILKAADWLASMDMIAIPVIHEIKEKNEDCFDLTFFEFSRFSSPFTFFAVKLINNAYEQNGWEILLSLENGSVFIGNPDTPIPQKRDIVNELYEAYVNLNFSKDEEIREHLSILISMEECDVDFRTKAQIVFDKYKAYKMSSNPEKGVCERCGSPHSERMQPTLGFLKGTSSSFSQIKAKYGDRATCGFCSFDNMRLRKDMSDSQIPIYVKIKSKIPELLQNNDHLVDFVKDMSSELQYADDLEDMKEIPFMGGMTVPEDFDLYLIKPDNPAKRKVEPLPLEGSLIIKVESQVSKKFSPKECRARLAALYHLLNLTLFDAAIGTEEQVGLFGEKVTSSVDQYYLSIAVLGEDLVKSIEQPEACVLENIDMLLRIKVLSLIDELYATSPKGKKLYYTR